MVHPKANTADGAKSVSYPRVFAGRKVATCVAEAAAWRCKCTQPPDSVGHPADVDDGLAGVVESTSVGEHKRDRPNTSHAGYDYHTGHDLGARGHFHADRHLRFPPPPHAGHHPAARPKRRSSSACHHPTSQCPRGPAPLAAMVSQPPPRARLPKRGRSSIQCRVSKGVAYAKH